MKEKFFEHYLPSDDEFEALWDNCIFTFDTNVLLNLYRYSEETRDELLSILERLSSRIWIPHQVGLEFHRHRLDEIYKQMILYDTVEEIISKGINNTVGNLSKAIRKGRHPSINSETVVEKLNAIKEEILFDINTKKENHPNLIGNDSILDKVSELFTGKVSKPYQKEKLDQIFTEGNVRFTEEVPPGYEDRKTKKGNSQYGDLVLWFQLIDYSKDNQVPIILVIDERKEDWWLKSSPGKILGPRPELIREFNEESGNSFYMYSADRFMKYSQEYLGHLINAESIKEVQEIREEDEMVNYDFITSGSALDNFRQEIDYPMNIDGLYANVINENNSFIKKNLESLLKIEEFNRSAVRDYSNYLIPRGVEKQLQAQVNLATAQMNETLKNLSSPFLGAGEFSTGRESQHGQIEKTPNEDDEGSQKTNKTINESSDKEDSE